MQSAGLHEQFCDFALRIAGGGVGSRLAGRSVTFFAYFIGGGGGVGTTGTSNAASVCNRACISRRACASKLASILSCETNVHAKKGQREKACKCMKHQFRTVTHEDDP